MHPQQNSPVPGPPQITSAPGPAPGLAIASLVCGIASFLTLLLTGIPAIIYGHMALNKIKRSNGALGGKGMSIIGLIFGYVSIPLTLIVVALVAMAAPVIERQQQKAQLMQASSNAKQLFFLFVEYDQDHGAFPDELEQFESEGYTSYLSDLVPAEDEEWIYFSGQSGSNNPENIVLASPTPIDDKRVILRINGSVDRVSDAEYQAEVKAQQSQ